MNQMNGIAMEMAGGCVDIIDLLCWGRRFENVHESAWPESPFRVMELHREARSPFGVDTHVMETGRIEWQAIYCLDNLLATVSLVSNCPRLLVYVVACCRIKEAYSDRIQIGGTPHLKFCKPPPPPHG